jgi:S-ribosylhomocysteine lyase
MVRCSDNSLYTGWTNDLKRRIEKHNSGNGAKYTRNKLPVQLVYYEKFSTKIEAMRREYRIKRLSKDEKEGLISMKERIREMDLIESFQVNHLKLKPGLYVSRKDQIGSETVTTFDIRMTTPNEEPVIGTDAVHAIEHLGATFLRNDDDIKEKTVYFGPMGCRTGFYLIMSGNIESKDIADKVKEMFEFIINFNEEIPGANAKECGNFSDMNLDMAKYYSQKYYDQVISKIKKSQMVYP